MSFYFFRQLAAEQFLMSRAYDVPAMEQVLTGHAILASGSLPLILRRGGFSLAYTSLALQHQKRTPKTLQSVQLKKLLSWHAPLDQPILKAYQCLATLG
jgi:hypothetical protein